jgi:hypothetical protein
MALRKRKKEQTTIYKALHGKLRSRNTSPIKKTGVNSSAQEG